MFQNSKISKLNINEASLNFAYEETPLNFKAIDYGPVVDVFFHNTYGFLQVVDEVVVDIGANVGDSSIYFALKGASRVIAVEPYPFTYNFASRNINSNKFQDKILLINSGYGRDHLARVNDKVISLGHSELKESSNGHDVQILSLKTIISTYDITCGILKMDCEGCEYNLLEESCDTLRIFKMIQLEYHYNQGGLVDKLESCGFKVRLTEPRKMTNKTALNPNCKVGYIYAEISDLKR
jgi:FkbM family methyltransferase